MDQFRVKEKRLPTRWDLDPVSSENPVVLKSAGGHAAWVNSKAFELAGITAETKEDSRGRILRDKKGVPIGIVHEYAMQIFWNMAEPPTDEVLLETARSSLQAAAKVGWTTIHHVMIPFPGGLGYSFAEIRPFMELHRRKKLPIRVWMIINPYHQSSMPEDSSLLDKLIELGLHTDFGDEMLKIGCIKIIADGSPQAHSAYLSEPYADNPNTFGIIRYPEERGVSKTLNRLVSKAHKAGFQLMIHAIGDRAGDRAAYVCRQLERF